MHKMGLSLLRNSWGVGWRNVCEKGEEKEEMRRGKAASKK
jgi:hypothetical protein